MARIGALLIILGFGSLGLRAMNMEFRILFWAEDMQPAFGIIVGVVGVLLVAAHFLMENKKKAEAPAAGQWGQPAPGQPQQGGAFGGPMFQQNPPAGAQPGQPQSGFQPGQPQQAPGFQQGPVIPRPGFPQPGQQQLVQPQPPTGRPMQPRPAAAPPPMNQPPTSPGQPQTGPGFGTPRA